MTILRLSFMLAMSVFMATAGVSQTTSPTKGGTIKYTQTMYFEFENMPADMPKSNDAFMQLKYNTSESLYEKDPENKTQADETQDGPRRWRRMRDRTKNIIYSNVDQSSVLEQTGLFGKDFLVSDSLKSLKWKISAGEQKNILGYICMKATFKDSLRNLVVYFTPQIPLKFGPDKFGGLPGIVLEVQSAQLHIIATQILTETPVITPPSKGDKVSRKEFDKIREEKMKEQREMWGRGGNEVRVIRQ